MSDFNENVINEFRANGGKVGGRFEGARMMLLTTTGAKSGHMCTKPVVYTTDGDRFVIIASKAGRADQPGLVPQPGGQPGGDPRGRRREVPGPGHRRQR